MISDNSYASPRMSSNMQGGINGQITSRIEGAKGNPKSLADSYAKNQSLLDLLALQEMQQMQKKKTQRMIAQAAPVEDSTVKDQLQEKVLNGVKQGMGESIQGIKGLFNQQNQAAQNPAAQNPSVQMAAQGGLMSQPAPNINPKYFEGGGIVSFAEGTVMSDDQFEYVEKVLSDMGINDDKRAALTDEEKVNLVAEINRRQETSQTEAAQSLEDTTNMLGLDNYESAPAVKDRRAQMGNTIGEFFAPVKEYFGIGQPTTEEVLKGIPEFNPNANVEEAQGLAGLQPYTGSLYDDLDATIQDRYAKSRDGLAEVAAKQREKVEQERLAKEAKEQAGIDATKALAAKELAEKDAYKKRLENNPLFAKSEEEKLATAEANTPEALAAAEEEKLAEETERQARAAAALVEEERLTAEANTPEALEAAKAAKAAKAVEEKAAYDKTPAGVLAARYKAEDDRIAAAAPDDDRSNWRRVFDRLAAGASNVNKSGKISTSNRGALAALGGGISTELERERKDKKDIIAQNTKDATALTGQMEASLKRSQDFGLAKGQLKDQQQRTSLIEDRINMDGEQYKATAKAAEERFAQTDAADFLKSVSKERFDERNLGLLKSDQILRAEIEASRREGTKETADKRLDGAVLSYNVKITKIRADAVSDLQQSLQYREAPEALKASLLREVRSRFPDVPRGSVGESSSSGFSGFEQE